MLNLDTLYTSIARSPHITFNLVIGPSNGPGSSTYPNNNIIKGISKLRTHPNTNILDYVHI